MINDYIRFPEVRLLDADKGQLGIVSSNTARDMAEEAGLDLVCVSPNADPPVCQIMDYGKLKFQRAKGAKEQRKKQRESAVDLKELKLRPNIAEHDYQVRLRSAIKFLKAGDKVRIACQFRGRELDFKENGTRLFDRMLEELEEDSYKIDMAAKMVGNQMAMVLSPTFEKGSLKSDEGGGKPSKYKQKKAATEAGDEEEDEEEAAEDDEEDEEAAEEEEAAAEKEVNV